MKAFIVVSCFVLAVTAEAGYSYPKPTSFGAGPANDGLSVALLLPPSQNLQIPTSFPALSQPHITQYSNSHSSFAGLAPISSHGSLGLGSHSSGGSLSLGSSYSVGTSNVNLAGTSFGGSSFGGSSFGGSSFGGSSFGNSLGGSFASGLQVPAPAPAPAFIPSPVGPSATNTVVQKHIYVHVPPPEEEELVQPQIFSAPQAAQKHYKIIFIKAPSGPSLSKQIAQAQIQQQQTEEKTLVYVLVKKPESIDELRQNIPAPALSQPSKPEVYFIKYKAQTGGGFSALPAPIPLSAPAAQTADFSSSAQSADFSSASLSSGAATTSVGSSDASIGTDALSGLVGNVIQPREPDTHTPAAEYGPPKH